MVSNQLDNELSGDHDFDRSLTSSPSGSLWGQTFSNPSGHAYSTQQSFAQQSLSQQLRVSSQPLTSNTIVVGRRGGCCLFNLGCIILFLVLAVPFGIGIIGAAFEDEELGGQISNVVSDAVCPNRSTLTFDSDSNPDFFEELETVRVECVTASGRVSQDLTEEARNLASTAVILIGGYLVLLVMNTVFRGIGSVVATTGGALSNPGRSAFSELSSGAPASLSGNIPARSTGRTGSTWVTTQDNPGYVPPTAVLGKRDQTARLLNELKEAYRRGGVSIEEYDRRRKQILEQI